MQTLLNCCSNRRERWGTAPAVAMHAKEPWGWSYAELWDATLRVAGYLRAQGVGPGDRVILWGANSPEWVAAFYGAQCLGAAVVPLDLRSQEEFLQRIEAQSEPRHLLLGAEQERDLGADHRATHATRSTACPARRQRAARSSHHPASRPTTWPNWSSPPAPPAIPKA